MIRSPQSRRYTRSLHADEKALALEQQPPAINGKNAPGSAAANSGDLDRLREELEKGSVSK